MFPIAYATEIFHGEKVKRKSSFDIIIMRKELLVYLLLEKIVSFPKANEPFYHCRFIPFFNIHCFCQETYFHDNIKSDGGYFMANCSGCGEWYHKKFFWDMKYYIHLKCFVAKNKLCGFYNLYNENKVFIRGGLMCGEIKHFQKRGSGLFFHSKQPNITFTAIALSWPGYCKAGLYLTTFPGNLQLFPGFKVVLRFTQSSF